MRVGLDKTWFGIWALLLLCAPAWAATSVAGVISTDTVWTVANGPYNVVSDVTVANGVTLTIEPGVSVYFSPGTALIVRGALAANGTSGSSIHFGQPANSIARQPPPLAIGVGYHSRAAAAAQAR